MDDEIETHTLDVIFFPLRLACELRHWQLTPIAVDCLGKLFTYNYWNCPNKISSSSDTSEVPDSTDTTDKLVDLILETVCNSFSGPDTTDERTQIQIVKVCIFAKLISFLKGFN